jgi:hypothetical protein
VRSTHHQTLIPAPPPRACRPVPQGFVFQLSGGTLTYLIRKKPSIVPEPAIWEGTNDTINQCRVEGSLYFHTRSVG